MDTVYAVSSSGVLRGLGVDTEDVFQAVLRFKQGGIATIENGWIIPNTSPCVNDIKFNITGTRGMINLDLSNSQMIERFTETESDRPDVLVQHFVHGKAKGFAYESIRHFVDKLVDGGDFLVSLEGRGQHLARDPRDHGVGQDRAAGEGEVFGGVIPIEIGDLKHVLL